MVGLLDVNVLVALLVPEHEHHAAAMEWFPMTTIDALEREVDRFIESLNNLSANDIVAVLPRVRRVVERLDEHLPLEPVGPEK